MRKARKGDLVMVNYYEGAPAYRVIDTDYKNGWIIVRCTDPAKDCCREGYDGVCWPASAGCDITTLACI